MYFLLDRGNIRPRAVSPVSALAAALLRFWKTLLETVFSKVILVASFENASHVDRQMMVRDLAPFPGFVARLEA
jgi:hypothetical protein